MNADYQYLVGKIQQALATDSRVNKLDVKITVRQGRVHLTGQTSSEERRQAITRVVSEAAPDMEVRNELTVIVVSEPAQPEVISD
jgi:osmotically-inducible protein OsmY